MTDRMDTEALQALSDAPKTAIYRDKDGDVCIDDGREWNLVFCPATDEGGSYLRPDVVDEIIARYAAAPALAAEVLELRAKLTEIAPALAVMHSEAKAAFDDLDAMRKRLSVMHRRAQRSEGIIERTAQASDKAIKTQLRALQAGWFGPGEKPHHYSPDLMAGGSDCRICGHDYDAHHATAHGDLA